MNIVPCLTYIVKKIWTNLYIIYLKKKNCHVSQSKCYYTYQYIKKCKEFYVNTKNTLMGSKQQHYNL